MSVFQLYDKDSSKLPYGMVRIYIRYDTNQTTTGGFIPLFDMAWFVFTYSSNYDGWIHSSFRDLSVSSANTVRHIAFDERHTQYYS